MNRVKKASEFHGNGCNCAQAVACAFADIAGIDIDYAKSMAKRYGGGAYKTCGALMGAYAIANLKNGIEIPENPAQFCEENSDILNEIEQQFMDKNKSTLCNDLKGKTDGKILRSCRGCVEDAAEILEQILERNK